MGDVTFQVSEAITIINQVHEQAFPFIIIEGEVASYKINQNKFVFFDIKDPDGSLSCFMMLFLQRFPLEDGMKVRIVAQPKLTKWGKFSLTVREVTPVGEGSLKKSYDILKSKLQAAGLFDISRKRIVPAIPQRIAVISSSQAAGYADFIKIIQDRWGGLEIFLYDVSVQGAKSPDDIINALDAVNASEHPYDVVAIIRGGGSADDLSTFNREDVVRAVAGSRTPTVLGVGHEVDLSLCDLVADVRAATPSNAAEILVPEKAELLAKVGHWQTNIQVAHKYLCATLSEQNKATIDRLYNLATQSLQTKQQAVQSLQRGLAQLNPQRVLKRGYAIVQSDNVALTSKTRATMGAAITIQFSDGKIGAKITDVS